MALNDALNITWPNADVGQDTTYDDRRALVIEQYSGIVEGTIERRSILSPLIPVTRLTGTDTLTNRAVGESTLQKVTPGEAPQSTKHEFGRNVVTVDTHITARDTFAKLEEITTNINVLQEVSTEHGKKIAKFYDQSFLIQGIKAARRTSSSYDGGLGAGHPPGHFGGSQETLAAAADLKDPVKLYSAIARLLVKMEKKDVDPRNDGLFVVVRPDEYYTLIQAEQLVNATYVTASGNKVNDGWVLKTYGIPVFSSNNLPSDNITNHLLSNTGNGNAFNGDFTKLGALVMAPRAIMAAETIPLATDIFYDKIYKCWFVDADLSYSAAPNRCEYAGTIELP